jgi:large subunit ribosomal protein L19
MAEDKAKNDVVAEETAVEPLTAPETSNAPAEEVKDKNAIIPGMIVRVHQKIKEITPKGDERERIQIFEGTVIAKKGKDAKSATITVRKIASGIGVERIFPLRLPTIDKIEVVKQLKVRRAKLYFMRKHGGRKMKEQK